MLGKPRTEIGFEFDMVFCFGIRLVPYAVFSTRIYIQHIARPVDSDRPINRENFRLNYRIPLRKCHVHPEKTQTRLRTRKASLVDFIRVFMGHTVGRQWYPTS